VQEVVDDAHVLTVGTRRDPLTPVRLTRGGRKLSWRVVRCWVTAVGDVSPRRRPEKATVVEDVLGVASLNSVRA